MSRTRTKRSAVRSPGRRNRKLQAQGFKLPMRTAVSVVVLACAGIFYLLLCTRAEALGRQIKAEEDEVAKLRNRDAGEEVRWNEMIGPRSLQGSLKRHNLTMDWPRPEQVVHIRDLPLWQAGAGQLDVYGQVSTRAGGSRLQ